MKKILFTIIFSCYLGLLSACSSMGCYQSGCSYTYNSQCGMPSCTDNTYIDEYSNPCPGPYDCDQ
ncbi:MAG: hypothetical protein KIT56_07290 [Gammaproteobacteria bacterium]|nr:hypothetical protein [Gammaproteobacteria bacterium]MCW5583664.1 hypothetical protein [Gammaproteobacteria bacterium]